MIWVLRKRGSAKYALHALFILLYSSVLMSSLASNNVPGSYGYWTAHHLTSWINWTNLMSLYESFFYCSACFECYYIHPQEPATAPTCILIPPYSSRTAPIHQYTPKQNNTPTYSRQLLRMNVITFETCWAIKTFIKCHQVGPIYSTSEFKIKPKYNNNYDRPWKYSILLASIKNCRKCRVPVQTLHTDSRPSDITVQKAKEGKRNSEEIYT